VSDLFWRNTSTGQNYVYPMDGATIKPTENLCANSAGRRLGGNQLAYQWRRNGTDIVGATNASYTTAAIVLADNGAQFDVVVSNAVAPTLSTAATLTVGPAAGTVSAWGYSCALTAAGGVRCWGSTLEASLAMAA